MDRQPTRSKRVREERRFDQTQLRAGGHGRIVNRDYGSHFLRWASITQEMNMPNEEALKFWAAGLIDGEGCFDIRVELKSEGAPRNTLQFVFQLGLRDDDGDTVDLLRNLVKAGSVSFAQNERITNAKPLKILTVNSLDDCLILRDFLYEAPLRSKKLADFETWAEALTIFEEHKTTEFHLTDELLSQMKVYQTFLREGRKYTPKGLPESRRNYITDVFLKWGWISKAVKQGESILDIGCGQDVPLLYILGNRIQTVPEVYVGVDLNNIPKKPGIKWADIYDNYDFVTNGKNLEKKYTPFDKAVCFECIEHMFPEDGAKLLDNIFFLLRSGGLLYLSTPVFDGKAAANHCHEYEIPELQTAIEKAGFIVDNRIGTFASKPAVKRAMSEAGDTAGLKIYDELEGWFGGDVMAILMAKNYPDASRNNVWICRKP